MDQNYGFTINFSTRRQTTRVTSYSLRNTVDNIESTSILTATKRQSGTPEMDSASLSKILSKAATEATRDTCFVAFKALPVDITSQYFHMGVEETESEQMKVTDCRQAVEFILRCILRVSQERTQSNVLVLEHKDIVR